jgi:4-hydroxy-3-methylbut-2-enyl diphosphate reductase IspH
MAADLRAEWFQDAQTVGITAGTSTPDHLIDEVEQGIKALSANRREEVLRPD